MNKSTDFGPKALIMALAADSVYSINWKATVAEQMSVESSHNANKSKQWLSKSDLWMVSCHVGVIRLFDDNW